MTCPGSPARSQSAYDFVKLHAAEFTLDGTALERPIRRGLLLYEAFAWGRGTAANGRQQSESPNVKQVPPAYAKPFRQGHKNDFRDAYAIAEAVQRPSTRCVPVKTDDQLDLQALHRVRSRLVGQRTAVINQIRGFLLEHGITVRQGLRFLRQQLPDILA